MANRSLPLLALLTIFVITPLVTAQDPPPVPPEVRDPRVQIAWNRYYDYPQVGEILRRLHNAYPKL
ncbi:MAG: hypothetical protein V3T77_00695, partial [Planctomycetota bacterium]